MTTFTDEHWECVRDRAMPILFRECVEKCVGELEDAKKARQTAQLTASNAQGELIAEDTPKNRAAVKDAATVLQDSARAVEAAQQKLQYVNSDIGKFDLFRDHWDTLADGAKLGRWCEEKELGIMERDYAKAQEAGEKTAADIAERKAKLGR